MLPVGKSFLLFHQEQDKQDGFFSCYFPHYNPELKLVWKAMFSHCSKYLSLFIQNTVKQLKSHTWGKQTPRKTARLPTRPCLSLSTSLAYTGEHWVETMLEGRMGCPKQNDFREQCWLRSGKGWEHTGQSQSRWPNTRMYISLSSKWRLKLFSFSFYTKVLKLLKAVSSNQSHRIQFYTQFHFARWKLWTWKKTSNLKHNPHEFMTVSTITYTAHLWPQKYIINTWLEDKGISSMCLCNFIFPPTTCCWTKLCTCQEFCSHTKLKV